MCVIIRKTDEAILETAHYFWSPKYSGETRGKLSIGSSNCEFDFNKIGPERLASILDIAPKSPLHLNGFTMSTQQPAALATRPYPVDLHLLNSFRFEDGGSASVDSLQSRQSPFGALHLSSYVDYNRE